MTTRWGFDEEHSYAESVKDLGIEVKLLDEILLTSTWLIARAADDDESTSEVLPGIRVVKSTIRGSSDLIRLWFTLDPDEMMAHLIRVDIESREDSGDDLPW